MSTTQTSAGSVSSTANATTAPTSISSTSASTTNFTTLASTRPYEATSIPGWGFIGPCDWISANKVDLTLSSIGILYNFIITLLPLFASRMYSIQGAVISSYSLGAFLVSVYSAFFHSRLLSVQDVDNEVRLFYLLTWFMNYLFLFHIHLLSWDQHHSLTHFKAHRRFARRSKVIKMALLVWVSATVITFVEAFFVHDPLNYPNMPQVSMFRNIVLLIFLGFCWFGTLTADLSWNASVFTFLLQTVQNGFKKEEPPENTAANERELPEYVTDPWSKEYAMYCKDPPEYATLPNDAKSQLTDSFVNLVMLTTFGSMMILWMGYHVMAIFRTGGVLKPYKFYEIIYRCELYLILYIAAKSMFQLNPLWCFYYRKEIRQLFSSKTLGVTHE